MALPGLDMVRLRKGSAQTYRWGGLRSLPHMHRHCSPVTRYPSSLRLRPHKLINIQQMCFTHQALVVWQHDNDLCIMIPNHSPEIFRSMWQRVLGYNKFIAPVIALQRGRGHVSGYLLRTSILVWLCSNEIGQQQRSDCTKILEKGMQCTWLIFSCTSDMCRRFFSLHTVHF